MSTEMIIHQALIESATRYNLVTFHDLLSTLEGFHDHAEFKDIEKEYIDSKQDFKITLIDCMGNPVRFYTYLYNDAVECYVIHPTNLDINRSRV